MSFHLNVVGFLLIGLAIVHAVFPKYFNWKDECQSLSLINRQMFYVHTFFIVLTLFLMGLFCLTETQKIIETDVGKTVALGFGIFWFALLVIQFFVYSSELWRGKTFETVIHILFSILWIYLSAIFFLIYFS
ncbi:MAG: hypothetical protein ACR2N3_04210 [Pyrinomonadaceae bacterium]